MPAAGNAAARAVPSGPPRIPDQGSPGAPPKVAKTPTPEAAKPPADNVQGPPDPMGVDLDALLDEQPSMDVPSRSVGATESGGRLAPGSLVLYPLLGATGAAVGRFAACLGPEAIPGPELSGRLVMWLVIGGGFSFGTALADESPARPSRLWTWIQGAAGAASIGTLAACTLWVPAMNAAGLFMNLLVLGAACSAARVWGPGGAAGVPAGLVAAMLAAFATTSAPMTFLAPSCAAGRIGTALLFSGMGAAIGLARWLAPEDDQVDELSYEPGDVPTLG